MSRIEGREGEATTNKRARTTLLPLLFPRSAHQPQPTQTSRSQSTRTPASHRDIRPTQPPSSHRTLPTVSSSLRHRPSDPSRTVSHSSSSSSSSQTSISSASTGESDSSSLESPVQTTTSWKDWALGRGAKAVGETEEEGRAEAVVELETKEDLSGEPSSHSREK